MPNRNVLVPSMALRALTAFYPGSGTRNFPAAFHRKFFFADHVNHFIKVLDIDDPKNVSDFATGTQSPVDIKFGADGVMYYLNRGQSGGSLLKVTYAGANGLVPAPGRKTRSGWSLRASAAGYLITAPGESAAQAVGLDGRSVPLRDGSTGAVADCLYFVRSR